MGSESVWGLGEGSNFQSEGLKIEYFTGFFLKCGKHLEHTFFAVAGTLVISTYTIFDFSSR